MAPPDKNCLRDLNKDSRVLVLVSGGVDSMVLSGLAVDYQREIGFELAGLHINYHLRGPESDRDEAFVRETYLKFGVKLFVVDATVSGTGIMNKTRQRRLEILRDFNQRGWICALLAHHADDQAETLWMRHLRGSGVRGLLGMRRESLFGNLLLYRPLLDFRKQELIRYALDHGISWVEDSSNAKDAYLRNRVRHAGDALWQWDADNLEALRVYSDACEKERDVFLKGCGEEIPVVAYFGQDSQVRFLILEKLFSRYFKKQFCSSHFYEMEGLLQRGEPFVRDFGRGMIGSAYGYFQIREKKPMSPRFSVSKPGSYQFGDQTLVIQKMDVSRMQAVVRSLKCGERVCGAKTFFSGKLPLEVRPFQAGDRFSPMGLGGTKKISDWFVDRKVPRWRRGDYPVLLRKGRVVGIVDQEIDQEFQIREGVAPFYAAHLKTPFEVD